MAWAMDDAALVHQYSMDLYFETPAMILTLITLGKFLESPQQRQDLARPLPS